MTLDQFMMAYQENRMDIFVICSDDNEELHRFGMVDYFTDYNTTYADCVISEFTVDVIDKYGLVFNITLDIPNPNAD